MESGTVWETEEFELSEDKTKMAWVVNEEGYAKLKLYDYSESVESMLANRNRYSHSVIPSVFVGWDNTPRRNADAVIISGSSPEKFERYLREEINDASGSACE